MKVLKFGGTSVGSIESLLLVKEIVEACEEQVIVVVSAMSGVTNELLAIVDEALKHRHADYTARLHKLLKRHQSTIEAVVPREAQFQCSNAVESFVNDNLQPLAEMLDVNTQLDSSMVEIIRNAVVCHGEVLSSAIVSCMIAGAEPHFAPNFIKTCITGDAMVLDWKNTEELVKKEFVGSTVPVHVVQGFIASDYATGMKTTLGRGGSDYTAAIIAAVLGARQLEIWTDVDGFYDSDPRTNDQAKLIPEMTYEQAQKLCDAGAKVIYPPTIAPVAVRHIPVLVKNTFNASAPGTLIN